MVTIRTNDELVALATTHYYESRPNDSQETINEIVSTKATELKNKVIEQWEKGKTRTCGGDYIQILNEFGPKPFILSGMYLIGVGINAFDPHGPASLFSGRIPGIMTRLATRAWTIGEKAILGGLTLFGSLGLSYATKNVSYLKNVPFISMNICFLMELVKGVIRNYMKPENEPEEESKASSPKDTSPKDTSPKEVCTDLSINMPEMKLESSSVKELSSDLRAYFAEVDPETGKPPLYIRLGLVGGSNIALIASTKFMPQGLIAFGMTNFAADPLVTMLRDWNYLGKYAFIVAYAGLSCSAIPIHPSLPEKIISILNQLLRRDTRKYMDPANGGADSDDEGKKRTVTHSETVKSDSWYSRMKGYVTWGAQKVVSTYDKVSSVATSLLTNAAQSVRWMISDKVVELFTVPDGEKPPIGQRAMVALGILINTLAMSQLFPGQVIEAIAASWGSAAAASFFLSLGRLPCYGTLTSLTALGYVLQHYVHGVPYVGNIQYGSIVLLTLVDVIRMEAMRYMRGGRKKKKPPVDSEQKNEVSRVALKSDFDKSKVVV